MNDVAPQGALTHTVPTHVSHEAMANAIRALAMDAVEQAQSGHPGLPMGMADVATVLFKDFLKFDPAHPRWPDRDRFVLSAGHGSMLIYALLYLTGFGDVDIEEIKRFRQLGSSTPGHPELGCTAGVETTTGPLGQGFGNAVGMAFAERFLAARFGEDVVDHYTYALASDGDLMEGVSHEAASLAGHLGLGKLIVLFDDNRVSIDGPTDMVVSEDLLARFRAYGWDVQAVDGHNPEEVYGAIATACTTKTPSLIACRTTIAYGAPTKAGRDVSHGMPLGAAEVAGAREQLGWPHPPFVVPDDILSAWRDAGARGADPYDAWCARHAAMNPQLRAEFDRVLAGELPKQLDDWLADLKRDMVAEPPKQATRLSSRAALQVLTDCLPEMVGGSADLTGSNGTKTAVMLTAGRDEPTGRYIHYGVREHAMGTMMNGMALHGGIIPFGGSFLVFTDYCRPAIRMAALMRQRVVYVMTHDSIGVGEDGPTHQPIEHVATLRAIPNLYVFRPADAVETIECWSLAIAASGAPSVIVLTRQGVPPVRLEHNDDNLCRRGAYILAEADGVRRVTLLATGSEVAVALEAQALLQGEGIGTAVVSMPCWELFDEQPEDYRATVLGTDTVRVAVEAATSFGWDRYVGPDGMTVCMDDFGVSAPGGELFRHFGVTGEAVAEAAKSRL